MTFLEKLRFNLWDGDAMVASLIETWQPEGCSTEKHYELSLYDHLHEHLEEVQVTKQFASGRIRADIAVGGRIIVELKNNLDGTAKYQRLVGQLAGYKGWDGYIFVVLCGTTDRNLLKELGQHLKDLDSSTFTMDSKFRLFEKA